MNLSKKLPLTETTFYVLLALRDPGHGYAVMQRVEELSSGKVRIAAGTMYGALDNLTKQRLIKSVPSTDKRRKMYQISDEGRKILELEFERLKYLVYIYNFTINGGKDIESI